MAAISVTHSVVTLQQRGAGPDDISILAVNSAEFNLVGNRVTSFTIKMWLASNVSASTVKTWISRAEI